MTKKSTPPAIAAIERATSAYLESVAQTRRQGNATEHSYRPALKTLLEAHLPGWEAVNEPVRQECGAPDFVVQKNGVALGYVEAKDIGVNLDKESESQQMKRYRAALPNLILTDYVEFRHYVDGKTEPAIARIADAKFRPTRGGADDLAKLLKEFAVLGESGRGESPTAERLAKIMAGKTRLLRDLVEKTAADPESELAGIYRGLRENLMRGLKLPDFADIFAQTAAYGLFAARLESERKGVPKFSRVQAGELLPQTTPFLRRFFNTFVDADMDERISWMADDIAAMFSAVSLDNVVRDFNLGGGQMDDPFLHFYETFLHEYDSKKRRARGVYFTPRPVVDFIVRAVDHSLIKDFKISKGLANEDTVEFKGRTAHKVQILDPAAGTGAFLARVAELVRDRVQKSAGKGGWKKYAPEHLLPRLHGFEILMSAYAMCHLKMALILGDDSRGKRDFRVNVLLANALEMSRSETGDLPFLRWLRDEALAADRVKNETPVMVVLGNPPYNVSSQNSGEWIDKKLEDYKKGLGERKLNLNDDYIKFIRFAEHFIEKNERGIVAMITNNSFLDGITHRQMRKHLLGTFDIVRILNLHGSGNIGECVRDGRDDRNVFKSVKQGVGIFIMAKTGKKRGGARVLYASSRGSREMKYQFLAQKSVSGGENNVEWEELRPGAPYYFFTPKDFSAEEKYNAGIPIVELFHNRNSGIQTKCDKLSVHFESASLKAVVNDFTSLDISELREKYPDKKDSSGWNFRSAKMELESGNFVYADVCYRPFDIRKTVYTASSSGFIGRSRNKTMDHLIAGENVALLTTRSFPANEDFTYAHVSRRIVDIHAGGGQTYVFPLWVWEDEVGNGGVRRANFNDAIAKALAKRMGMKYLENGDGKKRGIVSPESLFDYIYAVLHRPSYRREFAEFLRIDFPRIPPATDEGEFRRLAKLGGELRALHLLESPLLDGAGFPFSADGKDEVDKVRFLAKGNRGRIFINAKRHFANVPLVAWEYCVSGYRPAQRWLKNRKGRILNYDDQRHYRRMLSALAQTAELVGKLDGK